MFYLRIGIAIVVTVVWAVVVLGSFLEGKSAPPELSGIMLSVVTAIFTAELKKTVHRRRQKLTKKLEEDDSDE